MSSEPDSAAEPLPRFEERYVVEPNYEGWRLDRFLTEKLKRASRSRVVRIIKASVRFEDGRRVKPGAVVRGGDVVLIDRVERRDPASPPLEAVCVLYERDDLIVVDKPAGMLVHRTAREATLTVDAWARWRFPTRRVEPVHRLDRDTSGVLVCGRGEAAIARLRALFRDAAVRKEYVAVVDDPDAAWEPGDERTFDQPLGLDPTSAVGVRMGPGDLPCRTFAQCARRAGPYAFLDVTIEQGRQHQIRAHLSLFGTPLVGDKLYGHGDAFFAAWADTPGAPQLTRLLATRWHCLSAVRVAFADADEHIDVRAPWPEHIRALEE